jgi:aspartate-semialdehyde dehydrogenase
MSVIEIPKNVPRVALAGGETPLGADLRDILRGSILGGRVKLIGSEDTGALLTEEGGEPVVITALDADELNAAQVIFFAGSAEATRKAYAKLQPEPGANQPILVDLTGGLEDLPGARLRSPIAEPPAYDAGAATLWTMAHPAAAMTVAILRALPNAARAVVTAFEPASAFGRPGIEELHQQTTSLLSFQPLHKAIFDEQLAFNLLARYGAEAPESLATREERAERHLASLTAANPQLPLASFRLLQAPVMHGTPVSMWVELAADVDLDAITASLAAAGFDLRGDGLEGPNPVGMAAQDGIGIGSLVRDRNSRRALWLFAVADNYRLTAQAALTVARQQLVKNLS